MARGMKSRQRDFNEQDHTELFWYMPASQLVEICGIARKYRILYT